MQRYAASISEDKELQDTGCFIYKRMEQDSTKLILVQRVKLLPAHQLASLIKQAPPPLEDDKKLSLAETKGAAVWLIRESNKEGMLTVQSLSWNLKIEDWVSNEAQRLALTPQGWVNANLIADELEVLKQQMTKLRVSDFSMFVTQLLDFLKTEFKLTIENRINPQNRLEQSQNAKFQPYTFVHQVVAEEKTQPKPLPEDLSYAITCPLTEQQFIDPVVYLRDDKKNHLSAGQSYERAMLEAMGFQQGNDFYLNYSLKAIICAFSSQTEQLKNLEAINEEEINDALDFERLNDPVITPAGHTYSRLTINKYIQTQLGQGRIPADPRNSEIEITKSSLITNLNLCIFMLGWDAYYKMRRDELLSEQNPEHQEGQTQQTEMKSSFSF